ncbi:MAG: ferritin [Candidatus Ranarchaeia archaeon]
MEISQKMQDAINEQINAELRSAYLYLSMSAYFESKSLKGFARWMRIQASEEVEHATKFFDYVNERSGRVTLKPIEAVKTEWSSPIEAFEDTYKHELLVTSLIDKLVDLARSENDHASEVFLQWYVKEQVEEEDTASYILEQLKMIGDEKHLILAMDRELGKRKE